MKKLFRILVCISLLAPFVSCGKHEPVNSDIAVTSVKLDKNSLELTVGETKTLVATVAPDNATDKTVAWESSDPAVVTVDQSGNIRAVAEGSASVTASAGGKSDVCEVSVTKAVVEVGAVALDREELTLEVGETATLVATVSPADATDKSVRWNSSNPEVVSVSQSGVVTAVAVGTATVYAQAGDKYASCEVTVEAPKVPVESVSLNKVETTIEVGSSETLVATVHPDDASDKSVSWVSSDDAVATVDQNGKVTAIAEGIATITVRAADKSASCTVTVPHVFVPVSSISLNKTETTIEVGSTETLTAIVGPDDADDKTVTWTSSNTAVATVDQAGLVTAVAEGSAVITAKAGEQTASCTVTVPHVPVPVSEITLDQTELSLVEGKTATLTATVSPQNADDKTVSWQSSNTAVATVDQNGVVTAIAEGTATITATAEGKTATCAVTVVKDVVKAESVELNKTSLELARGASETLVATVKPDNTSDKTVTWSSSDPAVASVDQTGKVTAVSKGTASITATCGEKSAVCTVTVTGTPDGSIDDVTEEDPVNW